MIELRLWLLLKKLSWVFTDDWIMMKIFDDWVNDDAWQ